MIVFSKWNLRVIGPLYFLKSNINRIDVLGNLPSDWKWDLFLKNGETVEEITLKPVRGGACDILNTEKLELDNYYLMQLRGTHGEVVRHTPVVSVYIAELRSDNPAYLDLLQEHESRISTFEDEWLAMTDQELSDHPSIPGDDGFWMMWDTVTNQYVSTLFPVD